MANTHKNLGRYLEAEKIQATALELRRDVFGDLHLCLEYTQALRNAQHYIRNITIEKLRKSAPGFFKEQKFDTSNQSEARFYQNSKTARAINRERGKGCSLFPKVYSSKLDPYCGWFRRRGKLGCLKSR